MNSDICRANLALENLRTTWVEASSVENARLVEGIWIDADREDGDLSVAYDSRGPGLVTFVIEGSKPGRWLTLNVNLGTPDLTGFRMIGFAAKAAAAAPQAIRACVRSFRDDGFHDIFFPTYLHAANDECSHCDVLWIAEHPALIAPAKWRTLLLFLEPGAVRLEISEFNVFVA